MSSDKHSTQVESTDSAEEIVYLPTQLKKTQQKTPGVLRTEIYSKQYDKWYHKVIIFFGVFLISYAYGLDSTVRTVNLAYAQSSYSTHSLLSTVNCIQAVIAAAGQVSFARVSDIFGRITIFILSVVFYVVGTVIESQATNVQKFAAGAVFYQLGLTTLSLMLQIVVSDFSNLNWRVLASFTVASPFIINTWVSGSVKEAVGTMNWQFGIGMWSFIIPLACIPLFLAMLHMIYLSRKNGDLQELEERQAQARFKLTTIQYLTETFIWELDLIGVLLSILTFGLILVPFTLGGGLKSEWEKAKVIVPLILGVVVALPAFIIWEMKLAKVPLIPGYLIKDRGIYCCIISAVLYNFIWYQQGDYMYTVLVVGNHESVKSATRITQLYSFTSVITGFSVGIALTYIRKLKAIIIFGNLIWLLAMGLLIHFRGGNDISHSGIIGSLCLLGFGAGLTTYLVQCSIQTCVNHQHMAVVLSIYLASYSIGTALGSSVAGALWTNILPEQLKKRLSDPELVSLAYGSPFTFIINYTWETPERQLVVEAYKHIQKILCTVGTLFAVLLVGVGLFLRDHKLQSVVAIQKIEEKSQNVTENEDQVVHWLKRIINKK